MRICVRPGELAGGRAAVGEYRLGARFLFQTEVVWLGRDSAFELCAIYAEALGSRL